MSAQDIAPDKLDADQPFQDSSEALGATLAEARNRMGLEQREVASRLGLNPVLIDHLEKGDFEALGAPIYVRGYLTRYARFLDLPEQQILERHKRLGKNEVPPLRIARPIKPQAKMNDTGVRWFFYLLVFALIGSVGWQGFKQVADNWESSDALPLLASSPDDSTTIALPQPDNAAPTNQETPDESAATQSQEEASPTTSSPTTESASPATESAATASTTPEVATIIDEPASAAASATEVPIASDSANPQTAAATTSGEQSTTDTAESSTSQETLATTASTDPPELVIAFAEDCWVDIKDANGERLAYGIMKADTISKLTGTAPFSVTLGNSVGVREFTFNGNPVDPSVYIPDRGTVSRFSLGSSPVNQ